MNGQQLKNSILQMAVQGKLVPQDPNDEPASVLIQRIREEKEKLIKERKIKKEKNPSYIFRGSDNLHYEKIGDGEPMCIEEQIPFEIPDSWEWVRLGNIGETNIGLTYHPTDKTNSGGILVLRSNNIKNGKMNYDDCLYVSCKIPSKALICEGDILICARNGSRSLVGKCAIVDKKGMAFGAFMAKFSSRFNLYIKVFLDSPVFRCQLEGVKTETINQITQEMLKNQLVPLPPLSEQEKIVAKIEELIPLIDEYDTKESKISALNTAFPEQLKKSILQEAVQGKLVLQDPSDEPASILLEKIAKEKEKLIKESKIKKQKSLPPITEDEIPFDIPNSWEWVRLGNIATLTMGQSPKGTAVHEGGDGIEFHQGKICFTQKYLCKSSQKTNEPNKIVEPNTLLLCVRAPVGTVNITQRRICIGRGLCGINIHSGMDSDFMFYWLTCLKNDFIKKATGTTFIAITGNIIEEELIPLPPLEEQKRIVAKIEELMPLIEEFSKA